MYWFFCPGCKLAHCFQTGGVETAWSFNGNMESPSFLPSLVCSGGCSESRCHLMLTDGKLQFFNDCCHELAGKIVDLPELPDWVRAQ